MNSKIKLCNLALAHLGQAPISSLNQDDERARRLNLFYDSVRDEVLRTHNWGFAAVQEPLVLVRQICEKGDLYLYKYPVDALFVRRVLAKNGPQVPFFERFDNQTKTRVLVCRAPQAEVLYTRKVEDETHWDAAFVKAFTLALACDIGLSLTGDAALVRQLEQKYMLCLEEARRSNGAEGFHTAPQTDAFSEVR